MTWLDQYGTLRFMNQDGKIRLGISQCLLGDRVRYDGGHKRDAFLADTLSRFVEWVPVCPEVEVGLGTPRDRMQLEGSAASPHLITLTTRVDLTSAMTRFAERRVREMEALDLCGYVFKARSPSCGIADVPIYSSRGGTRRNGAGLFARSFRKQFPLVPIEDEDRLNDPAVCVHFLERVLCYRRWRDVMRGRVTRQAVIAFHAAHQPLVLAHSRTHAQTLDQLTANAQRLTPKELARRYGSLFMKALATPAGSRAASQAH